MCSSTLVPSVDHRSPQVVLCSIVKPVDWKYRVCGESPGVGALPYAIWPNPLLPDIKVCVSSCDASQSHPSMVPVGVNGGAGFYTSLRCTFVVPMLNHMKRVALRLMR